MAVKPQYFEFFFLSVILIPQNLHASQIGRPETDCQVHQTYRAENWSGKALSFLAFIEYGEVLLCKMAFKGKNEHLVYDQLVLSHEEVKLSKIRNGILNETTLNQFRDVAGWTLIEISMTRNQLILKYWDTTALNYTMDLPVEELSVRGSNITVCNKKSPTWMVERGLSAKIPLEPSRQDVNPSIKRTYVVNLRSNDDFTPCIIVGGSQVCLKPKKVKKTFARTLEQSPPRTRILDLYLELVTVHINIYYQVGGKRENITSFAKHGIKFIEVTSENSNFSVSLNIFQQSISSTNTSFVFGYMGDSDFLRNVTVGDTSFNNDKMTSLVAGLISGLAVCGIILSVLAIKYVIQRRRKSTIKTSYQQVVQPI